MGAGEGVCGLFGCGFAVGLLIEEGWSLEIAYSRSISLTSIVMTRCSRGIFSCWWIVWAKLPKSKVPR